MDIGSQWRLFYEIKKNYMDTSVEQNLIHYIIVFSHNQDTRLTNNMVCNKICGITSASFDHHFLISFSWKMDTDINNPILQCNCVLILAVNSEWAFLKNIEMITTSNLFSSLDDNKK
jgi:hypothetical protein